MYLPTEVLRAGTGVAPKVRAREEINKVRKEPLLSVEASKRAPANSSLSESICEWL